MKWICVYAAPQVHMAELMLHQLQAADIPARVFGDRAGLGGLIPLRDAQAEVKVPEPFVRQALLTLKLASEGELSLVQVDSTTGTLSWPGGSAAEPAQAEEEPPCAACGAEWEPGFGECWNCQQPR